jgi:hypothetical protein
MGVVGCINTWLDAERARAVSAHVQSGEYAFNRSNRHGVAYAWLIDPRAHPLEACAQEGGDWREIRRFASAAQVSVAPFDAATIALDDLRAPTEWRRGCSDD